MHSNYEFLQSTITKLKSQGVPLTDSVMTVIFRKKKKKLDEVASKIEIKVKHKFNQGLEIKKIIGLH